MDNKTKERIKNEIDKLSPEWLKYGVNKSGEKYFGFFTKKQMSFVLLTILLLEIVILLTIFILYK